MSEGLLSLDEINALTGDDVAYWLDNPFMGPDALAEKVRFWVTKSVQAARVDGFCTCYPERMGKTRDCGVGAHRLAAGPRPEPTEAAGEARDEERGS